MFNNLKIYIKTYIKRIISPHNRRKIYSLINKSTFSEIDIIFDTIQYDNNFLKSVMIDVGAHQGGSLEAFARAGWTVYAFEPDPKNRNYLKLLCKNYSNVKIDNRAVTDKDGELHALYSSDISSGITTLSPFHKTHQKTSNVETVTLRKICCDNKLDKVGFLKIDTEGFDLFVLKGFPWETIMPQIIICEYEDNKTKKLDYRYNDMIKYLMSYNYNIIVSEWYPVTEYGSVHKWRRLLFSDFNSMDPNGWGNIIAVKNINTYEKLSESATYYSNSFK
jgi:FkbM family methyltransferase